MTGDLRPGVLFDVDGTLVDTNYLHALAWSRAFRDAGEWAPMNAIHRLVGMGGDQLVPRLLGHDSPAAVAARTKRYRELSGDIRPFPRAAGLLGRAHDGGLAVVLATSSPRDELETLRRSLHADAVIDGQTTADDIGQSKPAPDVFLTAMATFGIDARHALVGRLRTRRRKLAASCRHATRHSDGQVSGVEFPAGPLAGSGRSDGRHRDRSPDATRSCQPLLSRITPFELYWRDQCPVEAGARQ